MAAAGMTVAMLYWNKDLVDRIVTKDPWYLPIWFMHPTTAVPYEGDGPEIKEFNRLMRDPQRRVNAEAAVLQAVKKRILKSQLDIGQWEGFASPFWMTFALASPPRGWSRKYLAISLTSLDVVERPVPSGSVMRLSVVMYPRATAAGLQAFSTSIFNSVYDMFNAEKPMGAYQPPAVQRNPYPNSLPESDESEKQAPTVPLLPSGIVIALHEAASNAQQTLTKELSRDYLKNLPPPPRGWVIADGTVRLVGTELALIFDFKVAFNPKNNEQCLIYGMTTRHHTRRRGMRIQTFEKPSLPPPPPQPIKHQQPTAPQPEQQLSRKSDHSHEQQPRTLEKPSIPVQTPVAPEQPQRPPPPQSEVPRPQEAPRKR
ncbi:hypothetical protein H072_5561 [Dactylellina haptotyla CBS 200.50]|uniref:Uncharacterized protein n=1 Tax=Dactylellina haptotyla (strain CBS 200.50) TaxID=1284197 RepID=S8AHE5_DACHA|nr:hypothetical protein H072_5561 [Dactylellina haptotyla CBS 200.50]